MATRSARTHNAPVTVRVPFVPASVAQAREQLKRWMVQNGGTGEQVEDARVVISELVANALRHAQPLPDGSIMVAWCVDRSGLKLSVTDGGSPTRPHRVNAGSSALAGRGMAIVESLADSWWAERTRSRSTVHALLSMG